MSTTPPAPSHPPQHFPRPPIMTIRPDSTSHSDVNHFHVFVHTALHFLGEDSSPFQVPLFQHQIVDWFQSLIYAFLQTFVHQLPFHLIFFSLKHHYLYFSFHA